jgi:acyl transferase domain-containing protein
MTAVPRTAFVFPGLNGGDCARDCAPLLALPGFGARWRAVEQRFAGDRGFAAFAAALRGGETGAAGDGGAWRWQALAVAAMQLAAAEALAARGVAADWLLGYSIGDLARSVHGGACTFDDVVAFAAALPADGALARGATVVAVGPAHAVAAGAAALRRPGLACSRLSARAVLVAGPEAAVASAVGTLAACGCRVRRLAACALHAPLQAPFAASLRGHLASAPLRAPSCRVFSTILGRPIAAAGELRTELAANVAAPFDLAAAVVALHERHGVQRFVDLGPGRHAQRFVEHAGLPVCTLSAADLLAIRATAA